MNHQGVKLGDISNITKLSRDQIRKVIETYRLRYFISVLGKRGNEFIQDIVERKPLDEIANKYHIDMPLVLSAFHKYAQSQLAVMKRCGKCGAPFKTLVISHTYCPKCIQI